MLIDNSYNVACTSKRPWVCCPNEATNVTSNMLITHSIACCHSSNRMLLEIILSKPLELLFQLLLAWSLQQGLCLQGCPEQPRPQLQLQLWPRPEAASSYASEDCMQCDTLRCAETHMVKLLTCKRRSAVVTTDVQYCCRQFCKILTCLHVHWVFSGLTLIPASLVQGCCLASNFCISIGDNTYLERSAVAEDAMVTDPLLWPRARASLRSSPDPIRSAGITNPSRSRSSS